VVAGALDAHGHQVQGRRAGELDAVSLMLRIASITETSTSSCR
jgi:hypothetical protein